MCSAKCGLTFRQSMTEGLTLWHTAELHAEAEQLGNDGKEGKTYVQLLSTEFCGNVLGHDVRASHRVAIKTFKPKKSPNMMLREARFQQMAAAAGASPPVYGVNTTEKYIVMQALDQQPALVYRGGSLPDDLQYMICALMGRLDQANVLQNDGNVLNLMTDTRGRPYMIDFGFAKKIDAKMRRKRGSWPNVSITLWGLVRGCRRRRVVVDILNQCLEASDPTSFFERGEALLTGPIRKRRRDTI